MVTQKNDTQVGVVTMVTQKNDTQVSVVTMVTQKNDTQLRRYYLMTVAKRKACLQPEKTHGYQYLFTVQFFDSYVYRSRINKSH